MRNFRKATNDDLDIVLNIIHDGKERLSQAGVDQWQQDGPDVERLKNDIELNQLYVLEKSSIIGVCAIIQGLDPNYLTIEGAWLSEGPDAAIHRFAIAKEWYGTGVSHELMRYAIETSIYPSVRIDTHHENVAMRKLIERNGFVYCGIITLSNGELRDAFELIV